MGKPVLQFLDDSILFIKCLTEFFIGGFLSLLKAPERGTEAGDLFLVSKDAVFQFCYFCGCLIEITAQITGKFNHRLSGTLANASEMELYIFS